MTESMGYKSSMAVTSNANGTPPVPVFDATSKRLEFISHDIKESIEIIEDDGLRGTRTRNVERVAAGNIKIGGSIKFQPTPAEFDVLLPYILGSAAAAGTYSLADTLPDMYVMVDEVAAVNTYSVRVTSAKLSCEPGKKLEVTINVVGKTLTVGAAGSFPIAVPAVDTTQRPYMMYDIGSGVTIGGTSYSIDKYELNIDNKIEPTYMQGQTATDLEPTDRVIKLTIQTKYTVNEIYLQTAARAGTPVSASVAFTNGANSLTHTFGNLVAASESPVVPGRQHLRLPLEYHVYGVSTTKELMTTNSP